MKNTIYQFAWLALCGSAMQLAASPPVIGVASSWGAFYVDDASVPGSATIFDGTSVKTVDASSNLSLNGGERVTLASNSAATIHGANLHLDRGTAEFSGSPTYRVEARSLRIGSADSAARVRVAIDRQNHVLVASFGGTAEVRNAQGLLVARVLPDAALSLSAAGPDSVDLSGVVQQENGKFYLTDDTTKVKFELHGSNLKHMSGKHVHVTGSVEAGQTAAGGAPQVVTVGTATVAGAAAGTAAAGAAATPSISALAIGAGVVAVGGTVGGLAATGVIGGSVSR